MHIINDIEGFFKDLETTVYAWFGTVRSGEEFKSDLTNALSKHITPVITGVIEPIASVVPDEQPIEESGEDVTSIEEVANV